MATLTEERLDTALGKVQLFRAGDGPPLVYLHSAGGEPTHGALEDLADDHSVISPVCRAVISGAGAGGYHLALEALSWITN